MLLVKEDHCDKRQLVFLLMQIFLIQKTYPVPNEYRRLPPNVHIHCNPNILLLRSQAQVPARHDPTPAAVRPQGLLQRVEPRRAVVRHNIQHIQAATGPGVLQVLLSRFAHLARNRLRGRQTPREEDGLVLRRALPQGQDGTGWRWRRIEFVREEGEEIPVVERRIQLGVLDACLFEVAAADVNREHVREGIRRPSGYPRAGLEQFYVVVERGLHGGRGAEEARDGRVLERVPERHAPPPTPEPDIERLGESVLLRRRRLDLDAPLRRLRQQPAPRLEYHHPVRGAQPGLDIAGVDDPTRVLRADEVEVSFGDGARGVIGGVPGPASGRA